MTTFTNNFQTIITIIASLIIIYIIMYPYYLPFYFENTLGRASLLLFIIAITFCNAILGVLATVAFIGLYNSRVIEGLETMGANPTVDTTAGVKKPDPKTTQASTPTMQPTAVSADTTTASKPLDKTAEPTVVPPVATAPTPTSTTAMPPVATAMPSMPPATTTSEGFNNMLSYSYLNQGRNRMLTIENYMRKPKSSNQMPISKHSYSKQEPMASYPGKQGFIGSQALV